MAYHFAGRSPVRHQWYLAQKKLNWAADFEFALFPYLINGIKNHLEDAYFRDMSGCELAEIERAAGQRCQPIGPVSYTHLGGAAQGGLDLDVPIQLSEYIKLMPLEIAVFRNDVPMIHFLLEHGAANLAG